MIEMKKSDVGTDHNNHFFVTLANQKKDKLAITATIVSLLSLFFSICTWFIQLNKETNDFIKVFYGVTSDYSVEYNPIPNNTSHHSFGTITLSYPLIISNMSNHRISIINSQIVVIIDGKEVLYSDRASIFNNHRLLDLPLTIDANDSVSILIRIDKQIPGAAFAEYIDKLKKSDILYSDLLCYYEDNQISLPEYRIILSTARGYEETFDLLITSGMIVH